MSRLRSIAKATTLEILSEPLSLLLSGAAVALSALAPAFHYHQFGEPTRMAREAGLSALLVCGLAFATFGTLRTFRRELETGTAAVALSLSVSRSGFLLAKVFGSLVAYLLFAVSVFAVTATVVRGAEIGAFVAGRNGDLPKLWGPSLACALGAFLVPVTLAALLNRFARCRFVLTAMALFAGCSLAALAYAPSPAVLAQLAPVAVVTACVPVVFLAATAAASVRLKANAALSAVALALVAFVPALGNYCVSDALSAGGSLSWAYVARSLAWAALLVAGFLLAGIALFNSQDLT